MHKIIKIQLHQIQAIFWMVSTTQKSGLCLHGETRWHAWDLGLGTPCEPVLWIQWSRAINLVRERALKRRVLRPLHIRDREPGTKVLQALSLVEKGKPVQVRLTLHSRDQRSIRMRDGCKVYTNSYTTSNGSRFTVTRTIFKNHLLEVNLTQNHPKTTTLRTLTTVVLFPSTLREDPRE